MLILVRVLAALIVIPFLIVEFQMSLENLYHYGPAVLLPSISGVVALGVLIWPLFEKP